MTTTTFTPTADIKKLMANIAHSFKSPSSWIGETLQNARRANATKIDITFDPDTRRCVISDDGDGIDDFAALVSIAVSGWNEQTTGEENPFGIGSLAIIFASESVTFASKGSELTVCEKDIVNLNPLTTVKSKHQNTTISFVLREQTASVFVNKLINGIGAFPLPIRLNGISLPRYIAKPMAGKKVLLDNELCQISLIENIRGEQEYLHPLISGGALKHSVLQTRQFNGDGDCHRPLSALAFYYQHLPIGGFRFTPSFYPLLTHDVAHSKFVVEFKNHPTLTPVLPDRASFQNEAEVKERIQAELTTLANAQVDAFIEAGDWEQLWQHHEAISELGRLDIFNECDILPERLFMAASEHEVQGAFREARFTSIHYPCNTFYKKADLAKKKVVAYSSLPDDIIIDYSEDITNAPLLYLAAAEALVTMPNMLDEGHWLHGLIADNGWVDSVTCTVNKPSENTLSTKNCWECIEVGSAESLTLNGVWGEFTYKDSIPLATNGQLTFVGSYLGGELWWFYGYWNHEVVDMDIAQKDEVEVWSLVECLRAKPEDALKKQLNSIVRQLGDMGVRGKWLLAIDDNNEFTVTAA